MSYQTHSDKVSMIMACYNKAGFISRMFDSILAQTYDNIELIIVNDGSTDGTRDIFWDYSDKFRDRGFEVVIIEQKNSGVCAANKAGFAHVTGDFVCAVDADDLLAPDYCKAMVEALLNSDADYAVCGHETINEQTNEITHFFYQETNTPPWHLYLCDKLPRQVWSYMTKRSYFDRLGIAENYFTDTRGSHEPAFTIPLLLGGGKIIYIEKPLYRFAFFDESHSNSKDFAKRLGYYNEYARLGEIALTGLAKDGIIPDDELSLRKSEFTAFIYAFASFFLGGAPEQQTALSRSAAALAECLTTTVCTDILHNDQRAFISMAFTLLRRPYHRFAPGRIIGWGVLGKRGIAALPLLESYGLNFDLLWDNASAQKTIDIIGNHTVTAPCPEQLLPSDTVIVFPADNAVIIDSITPSGCRVITVNGAKAIISALLQEQI